MFVYSIYLGDKKSVSSFGNLLSKLLYPELIVFFVGNLGSGKTFLIKGIIGSLLKYKSDVKSPTYSLVETYNLSDFFIHHFDFYRLYKYDELNDIDFNNYLRRDSLLLVEWGNRILNMACRSHINVYFFYYSNFFNRIFYLKSYFFNFKILFG